MTAATVRSCGRQGMRSAAESGYTLVELLVALVVSGVAMTIAAQLLLEAQRQSLYAAREALDPVVQVTLKQLRADVYAASSASGLGYTQEFLFLHGGQAGEVEYELVGDELVRRVVVGRESSERVVLSRIQDWSWSLGPSGQRPLLYIDFSYLRSRPSATTLTATYEIRRETLVLTLRGGGGRSW